METKADMEESKALCGRWSHEETRRDGVLISSKDSFVISFKDSDGDLFESTVAYIALMPEHLEYFYAPMYILWLCNNGVTVSGGTFESVEDAIAYFNKTFVNVIRDGVIIPCDHTS